MNVYFDNAATTMVREEAVDAMVNAMRDDYGNPSSLHGFGRRASLMLETARAKVANALCTKPDNIFFTSGGTEANNWAVRNTLRSLSHKGKHIITSSIEHSAVSEPIKALENTGWEVTYLSPDSSGRINLQNFSDALRQDTVFASIMLVNNEVGAVNPIYEFSQELRRRALSTVLHTDAVQGLCKIPMSVKELGADLVAVSAHKLHGPKGAGALFINDKVKIDSLFIGGKQEKGNRGGTEPLPGAVGFGVAAELGVNELSTTSAAVRSLREYTSKLIKENLPDAVFIGEGDSPFLLCVSLPGYKSEVLMNYLDSVGVCVSNGSACKKGARSRTLEAMRLRNDVIDGALRISFSRYSTREEAEYFLMKLKSAADGIVKAL